MNDEQYRKINHRLHSLAAVYRKRFACNVDRTIIDDLSQSAWVRLLEVGVGSPRFHWEAENAMRDEISRWLSGVSRGQRERILKMQVPSDTLLEIEDETASVERQAMVSECLARLGSVGFADPKPKPGRPSKMRLAVKTLFLFGSSRIPRRAEFCDQVLWKAKKTVRAIIQTSLLLFLLILAIPLWSQQNPPGDFELQILRLKKDNLELRMSNLQLQFQQIKSEYELLLKEIEKKENAQEDEKSKSGGKNPSK